VWGVAREVAALTGAALRKPSLEPVAPGTDEVLPVKVDSPDLCGRFSGRVIRHLDPRASTPRWMVERLARCGQRSVSALVDISNYVMFESGQPSHIFDLDKIHGGLRVRWARAGESLKLLNGNTVELDEKVGVIADDVQVESLAGIMGGDATAVSDDTSSVYVEAAFWWPASVAGRSRRYNFATDAGHRFERGVDPAPTVDRIERLTRLIVDICGRPTTVCGPIDDQTLALPGSMPVTLRVERAAKVIGMPVTDAQCADVMTRLGLDFTQMPGQLIVTPPTWRFDLQIEEDLIEEVVRVRGFNTLPDDPPRAPITARVRPEALRSTHSLRHQMAARGYFETINFSFVEERWEHELAGNPNPIRVLNPIASPLSVMRSSLIGGLLQVVRYNLARKALRGRVFEIGRVFWRDASAAAGALSVAGVDQPLRLGGLAWGAVDEAQWGSAERVVDFFDVKGDVEAVLLPERAVFVPAEHPALHPGRSARIEIGGIAVGHIGELHPRWRQAYDLPSAPVLFEVDLAALLARRLPAFAALPRQQSVWRDVALMASDAVTHEALISAILATPNPLIRSAQLFDVFKPPSQPGKDAAGERSLAVRIELLDEAQPLTDERTDGAISELLARLQAQLGVHLRGH
jgi:phenylalanyl-tRNA synthetase beta chain